MTVPTAPASPASSVPPAPPAPPAEGPGAARRVPRAAVLAGAGAGRVSTVDPWYAVNVGRHRARAVLTARPVPGDAQPCPWVFRGPRDGD